MSMAGLSGRAPRKSSDPPDAPLPENATVLPISVKAEYDSVPVHVFHPTPYDTITVLRSRKDSHRWFVAGWYLGLSKREGQVKGLIYRRVVASQDRDVVLAEIKRFDKEASVSFELQR